MGYNKDEGLVFEHEYNTEEKFNAIIANWDKEIPLLTIYRFLYILS